MVKPKKLITIIYPDSDWARTMPGMEASQRRGYEDFFTLAAEEYGITVTRASQSWYANGVFERAWTFERGRWAKVRRRIRPHLVMDKSTLNYAEIPAKAEINSRFPTINPWELDLLASDKLLTSVAFSEVSPRTFLVTNKADLKQALRQIKGPEVIIKPRLGFGGKGIVICNKTQAAKVKRAPLSIVQPWINTKKGIPGLYKGIHDFRVVFAGEKPIIAYIRTPAPGTKLCNISQGGGVIFVPVSKIPVVLKPALQHILSALRVFPQKVFSVDFFFENGRTPYLVELNTKPIMMFPEEFRADEQKMHVGYLDYFESLMH
jgi:glutathione synthase/RimK-type ligase-like ATP-grasp enzyme